MVTIDLSLPDAICETPQSRYDVEGVLLGGIRGIEQHGKLDSQVYCHTCKMCLFLLQCILYILHLLLITNLWFFTKLNSPSKNQLAPFYPFGSLKNQYLVLKKVPNK